MGTVVADTSALVSLGTVADEPESPLGHVLDAHDVLLPERVLAELRETANYDDASGNAARAVLDERSAFEVRTVELDETFPLDDGENAAVTLATDCDATQLLCDEFDRIALVHASLTTPRLVTTPTLLSALVHDGRLDPERADQLLDEMSEARSWESNAYVQRARSALRGR